ncbi:1614_t:CDS:2, partial [Dentiscutata erythropus]
MTNGELNLLELILEKERNLGMFIKEYEDSLLQEKCKNAIKKYNKLLLLDQNIAKLQKELDKTIEKHNNLITKIIALAVNCKK